MEADWNELRAEALRTNFDTFREAHPAYLLAKCLPDDGKTEFKTKLASRAPSGGHAGSEQAVWLIRLAKRPGGLYPERISVGRTRTSDIVIAHAKVSKFHGFFEDVGGDYRFTDFSSTNGTFVNGEQLSPRTPRPLADGDRLRFGEMEFQFLLPETLYALLREDTTRGNGETERGE